MERLERHSAAVAIPSALAPRPTLRAYLCCCTFHTNSTAQFSAFLQSHGRFNFIFATAEPSCAHSGTQSWPHFPPFSFWFGLRRSALHRFTNLLLRLFCPLGRRTSKKKRKRVGRACTYQGWWEGIFGTKPNATIFRWTLCASHASSSRILCLTCFLAFLIFLCALLTPILAIGSLQILTHDCPF